MKLRALLSTALAVALIAGCGGGGGEAGGPASITVNPPEVKDLVYPLSDNANGERIVPNVNCRPGLMPEFLGNFEVFGGKSPVRINAIDPNRFRVDINAADPRKFELYHLGGCVTGPAVQIVDANEQQIINLDVAVSYEKASSE